MRICNKSKTVTLYVIGFETCTLVVQQVNGPGRSFLKKISKIMFFYWCYSKERGAGYSVPAHQRQCTLL